MTDDASSSYVNADINIDGYTFQLQEFYYLLKHNIINNNKGAHLNEI